MTRAFHLIDRETEVEVGLVFGMTLELLLLFIDDILNSGLQLIEFHTNLFTHLRCHLFEVAE